MAGKDDPVHVLPMATSRLPCSAVASIRTTWPSIAPDPDPPPGAADRRVTAFLAAFQPERLCHPSSAEFTFGEHLPGRGAVNAERDGAIGGQGPSAHASAHRPQGPRQRAIVLRKEGGSSTDPTEAIATGHEREATERADHSLCQACPPGTTDSRVPEAPLTVTRPMRSCSCWGLVGSTGQACCGRGAPAGGEAVPASRICLAFLSCHGG